MTRRCIMLVTIVVVLALPAAALARLGVSGPGKTSLVSAALGKQVPRQCAAVYLSSENRSWGSVRFSPQHGWTARCVKFGSDGVVVLHRAHGKWHVVTAGSDFTCPIRHVPVAVARDLRISCR